MTYRTTKQEIERSEYVCDLCDKPVTLVDPRILNRDPRSVDLHYHYGCLIDLANAEVKRRRENS